MGVWGSVGVRPRQRSRSFVSAYVCERVCVYGISSQCNADGPIEMAVH